MLSAESNFTQTQDFDSVTSNLFILMCRPLMQKSCGNAASSLDCEIPHPLYILHSVHTIIFDDVAASNQSRDITIIGLCDARDSFDSITSDLWRRIFAI